MPRRTSITRSVRGAVRTAVFVGLLVGLSACVSQTRNHGYLPSEQDLSEIVIGVDSRETVADLVGTPTTAGVLSAGNFYYVGDTTVTRGWRAPKIVDRQIVAITFDEAGIVQNVTRYGLEDGRVVPIVRRVTESTDGDISFVRRLFGNVGGIDTGGLFDG